MSGSRVAIVHERFTELGGSERVVEQLYCLWPEATVHTTVVDPAAVPAGMAQAHIRSSYLQRAYRGGRGYAHLLPLLPSAVASLDVSHADLVVVSHHAFANRVRARPDAVVISYTHTPARWMWDPRFLHDEVGGPAGRRLLAKYAAIQRPADVVAAARPDAVIANSRHVAARVKRWWRRDAEVVPPPVDVARLTPDPSVCREPFFLLAGRLVPYKRPNVAAAAARRAGVSLVVAGDGRMRGAVEKAGGASVTMLGRVDDATLLDLYRRCQALVFPGEEDFGVVPVEAQACGAPVLARRAGGVLDSVVPGVTGVLYPPEEGIAEVDTLARAMREFDPSAFDARRLRSHAEGFAPERFRERFLDNLRPLTDHSVVAV